MYIALHNMDPLYLTQFQSPKCVPIQLRCNDQHLLQVPLTLLRYPGKWSFQKAALMLYYAMPVTIKTSPSLAVFTKCLKTYFFIKSLHGINWCYIILFRFVMHHWVANLSDIHCNINCLLYCISHVIKMASNWKPCNWVLNLVGVSIKNERKKRKKMATTGKYLTWLGGICALPPSPPDWLIWMLHNSMEQRKPYRVDATCLSGHNSLIDVWVWIMKFLWEADTKFIMMDENLNVHKL